MGSIAIFVAFALLVGYAGTLAGGTRQLAYVWGQQPADGLARRSGTVTMMSLLCQSSELRRSRVDPCSARFSDERAPEKQPQTAAFHAKRH